MNIDRNIRAPQIGGFQVQTKKTQPQIQTVGDNNEPKAKVGAELLSAYNGVSFKGKGYDGTNFRNELFERAQVTKSDIIIDNETKQANVYKTKHSEYVLMPDNNKIYKIRYCDNEERVKQQVLASKLYQSVGIRTPEYIEFEKDGNKGYLVEVFEEKLENAQNNKKALYEAFVADVWLGNRNGLNKDNTKVDKDGIPVKMSVSGSLGYRAAGAAKSEPFSRDISEIKTMRDSSYNRESAQLLASMSDEELYEAITTVSDRYSCSEVDKITGSYSDNTMTGRLDNILNGRIFAIKDFIKNDQNEKLIRKRGLTEENLQYTNISSFKSSDGFELKDLRSISDEEWEILSQRGLLTPSSTQRKFSIGDLKYMCKMTDDEHQAALKRGLYKSHDLGNYNGEAIHGYDMADLANLSEEDWNKTIERNLITIKRDTRISYLGLSEFIQASLELSDEAWQGFRTSGLANVPFCNIDTMKNYAIAREESNQKYLYPSLDARIHKLSNLKIKGEYYDKDYCDDAGKVLHLASVDNDKWSRLEEVTTNFRDLRLSPGTLISISMLDDNAYNVLKSRGIFDIINNDFGLEELSLLSDEEWANVQKRNLPELRPDKYDDWAQLAALTDEEYQIVLDKHLLKSRTNNDKNFFSGEAISMLVKALNEDDWKRAEQRGLINNFYLFDGWGMNLANAYDIVGLSTMPDNDFAKFQKIIYSSHEAASLYPGTLMEICELDETELQRFFDRKLYQYRNTYEAWDNYMEDAPVMKALSKLDNKEYQAFLNQKNDCKTIASKVLIIKADELGLDKKHELSELTAAEKRQYLQLLLEKPKDFLDDNFKRNFNGTEIVPKNIDEYTIIMKKLLNSVGIDFRPISGEEKQQFLSALDQLGDINCDFSKLDIRNSDLRLKQEYQRKDFISDTLSLVSGLSESEQMKVYDYFGFDIQKTTDGSYTMNGYPVLMKNEEKLENIKDEATKSVIAEMQGIVEKFTVDNKITAQALDTKTQELLNTILNTLPELQTMIDKKQHGFHDYTLDVHTLGVLQECIKNPEFQTLSKEEKQTLMISALLHDITKPEKKKDANHPANSAYDAYYILDKLNLPQQQKLDIYQIIKNHEMLAHCNSNVYDYTLDKKRPIKDEEQDKIVQKYAYELRSGNCAKLEMMLTKADLLSIKRDGSFYRKFEDVYNKVYGKLENEVQNVRATSIPLPQTKIPKASELKADGINLVEKVTYDENGNPIKNKVLYMSKDLDLEALGFGKGVNADNFSVLIHGFDDEIQQVVLDALDLPDKNALLSTSYVTYRKGNYHAFRPQGLIKEVLSDDIGAAYYRDFGSGYKKTIESLVKNYISGQNVMYRTYFPDLIKKELNISDEEFIELYESIKNKSLEEIEKENPTVAKAFRTITDNMEVSKRKYNRDYNEILVGKSRNVAVFFEGTDTNGNKYELENVPEFLRKYAQDNDLPIIYFGE